MGKFVKRSLLLAAMLVVVAIAITGCGANAQNDKDVTEEKFAPAGVTTQVESETFLKGIDVSQHQGTIDATKVDAEIVVIRIGYSGYVTGKSVVDNKFVENMNKFSATDCEIALYWASHAVTAEEVEVENKFIVDTLNSLSSEVIEKIDYLFIDREKSYDNGRADNLSKAQFNEVLVAQIDGLKNSLPAMNIGVYTNVDYLVNMVDTDKIGDVPYWIAWYIDEVPSDFEDVISRVAKDSDVASNYLLKNIVMWQYSEEGSVNGISENVVDLNLVSSKVLG